MSAEYYGLTDKKTPNLLLIDETTGQLEIYETKKQAECFSNKWKDIVTTKVFISKDSNDAKQRIKELKQQNAELIAYYESFRLALEELAKLGNGNEYGNSKGNEIAIRALEATPKISNDNTLLEIENLTNECNALSMQVGYLDSKLRKLEDKNSKLKNKNKSLTREIEATNRQVSMLADYLGKSERKNKELIAQVCAAEVHTIDETSYIKYTDIDPKNSSQVLNTIKYNFLTELIKKLPSGRDEDRDISIKWSDLYAYRNRLDIV